MIRLPRGAEYALSVLLGTLCAAALCLAIRCCEAVSWGGGEVEAITAAIERLQPSARGDRARDLAPIFASAGAEVDVDPLLLVAIAMRESSLSERVERLERLGARGERGLMQCHGAALRARPPECGAELEGAACQVRTGARWLAHVRDRCPGSTWRWVAAYGWSRCPSEVEARADRNAAIAASYYSQAGGVRW